MENFHLFDEEHRSSFPLCIAYEAAKLTDLEKADAYLYALRRATIVETRQTTKTEELISCAEECGIDVNAFAGHLNDGSARNLFNQERKYARNLGIRFLPVFPIRCGRRQTIIGGLPDFGWFVSEIESMTKAE